MIVIPNTLLKENNHLDSSSFYEQEHKIDLASEQLHINHSTILIPMGIIGFESIVEYSIELMEGGIIYKLAGIQDQSPLFYLINPYLINRDYVLAINDEDYEILGKPNHEEIIVLSILTLKDDYTKVTCNLLGPLVFNNSNGVGVQVINDSEDWGTKHLLSTGKKVIESFVIED